MCVKFLFFFQKKYVYVRIRLGKLAKVVERFVNYVEVFCRSIRQTHGDRAVRICMQYARMRSTPQNVYVCAHKLFPYT